MQLITQKKILIPDGIARDLQKAGKCMQSISIMRYIPLHAKENFGIHISLKDFEDVLPRIKIVRAKSIVGHEKTSKAKVAQREHLIGGSEFWAVPLIDAAEKGSSILVLNGHHKHKAAKKAKLSLRPVLLHDYEQVDVGTWYPVLEKFPDHFLRGFGAIPCKYEDGIAALKSGDAYFMAVEGNGCHMFKCSIQETGAIVRMQKKLVKALNGNGLEYMADMDYSPGSEKAVLVRKSWSRDEIWEYAHSGKLFPQKSTRHNFGRRAKMELPLEWLNLPLEEANRLVGIVIDRVLNELGRLPITESG